MDTGLRKGILASWVGKSKNSVFTATVLILPGMRKAGVSSADTPVQRTKVSKCMLGRQRVVTY